MNKVAQGGWVLFAITAFYLVITLAWTYERKKKSELAWTYGRKKKSEYEENHLVDDKEFGGIVARSTRVPGTCFFFMVLMDDIPPSVRHYAEHTGCLRELLLFAAIRILPVRSVLPEERFLVAKESAGVYRCIVRYGYMDKKDMEGDEFTILTIAVIKEVADSAEEVEMMGPAHRNGVSFVLGRTILKMGDRHNSFKHRVCWR